MSRLASRSELPADPLLLDPEEVERNRVCVVGFEQLRPLVEGALLSRNELLAVKAGGLSEIYALRITDAYGRASCAQT
jgi:hypothetical protein